MGMHRSVYVYCDRCWVADEARFASSRPAREHARDAGWLLNRNGKDYCPNCREVVELSARMR